MASRFIEKIFAPDLVKATDALELAQERLNDSEQAASDLRSRLDFERRDHEKEVERFRAREDALLSVILKLENRPALPESLSRPAPTGEPDETQKAEDMPNEAEEALLQTRAKHMAGIAAGPDFTDADVEEQYKMFFAHPNGWRYWIT